MEVGFEIAYHEAVIHKDIPRLPKVWRTVVRTAVASKLAVHPDIFGVPLRRSLKGYRKLRVGDYRIVFRIDGKTVKIFVIEHRSVVYRLALKRI